MWSLRFRELEVELVGGDERALRRLEKELRTRRRSAARSCGRSSSARSTSAAPEPIPTPRRGAPAGRGARSRARRAGPGDAASTTRAPVSGRIPRSCISFRVATRRLRAFLRVARPMLDRSWSEPLRAELRWLGGALGPARDLDVLERAPRRRGRFARRGSGRRRRARRGARARSGPSARRAVVEALSSDRYLALLDRLEHVGAPETAGEEVPLAKLWRAEWRRTRKVVDGLDEALVGRGAARGADSRQARPLRGRAGARTSSGRTGSGSSRRRVTCRTSSASTRTAPSRRSGSGPGRDSAPRRRRGGPAGRAGAQAQGGRPRRLARCLEGTAQGSEAARVSAVRAAGGVPVRAGGGGLEVLIVHRPQYGDWTFPKGKCEPGRERRGVRAPRGRGGDGPSSARSRRSCRRRRTSTRAGAPKRRALLAPARRRRRADVRLRGRRGALAARSRRRLRCSRIRATLPCSGHCGSRLTRWAAPCSDVALADPFDCTAVGTRPDDVRQAGRCVRPTVSASNARLGSRAGLSRSESPASLPLR